MSKPAFFKEPSIESQSKAYPLLFRAVEIRNEKLYSKQYLDPYLYTEFSALELGVNQKQASQRIYLYFENIGLQEERQIWGIQSCNTKQEIKDKKERQIKVIKHNDQVTFISNEGWKYTGKDKELANMKEEINIAENEQMINNKEKELINQKKDELIKEISFRTRSMVKEFVSLKMENYIKEIGKKTKCQEKEQLNAKMESLKDYLKMERRMEKEFFNFKTEICIKENGKKIYTKEWEFIILLENGFIREIFTQVKEVAKGFATFIMEINMKENGQKTSARVKDYIFPGMDGNMKEIFSKE